MPDERKGYRDTPATQAARATASEREIPDAYTQAESLLSRGVVGTPAASLGSSRPASVGPWRSKADLRRQASRLSPSSARCSRCLLDGSLRSAGHIHPAVDRVGDHLQHFALRGRPRQTSCPAFWTSGPGRRCWRGGVVGGGWAGCQTQLSERMPRWHKQTPACTTPSALRMGDRPGSGPAQEGPPSTAPPLRQQGSRAARGSGVGKEALQGLTSSGSGRCSAVEDDRFVLPVLLGNADHSDADGELRFIR